ncbi:hypothetical protein HR059_07400 [Sinorhizobium meliloti WSM1022]|uniref:hypothetical protein n=1 Tax=Rhizobium meliloti TaxID=382 RepID=UPI0004053E58|nr:hypothetical protein [Sinorhizobium meliloti]QKN14298.1 hypothetical protein HR059_07400 [Sinorhizobium meliloti WSM1022]
MNPAIEEPLDTLDDDLGLLMELLGDEPVIAPKEKPAVKRNAVAIADMTDVEFRAYKARKQSERRASLKARESSGSVKFDASSTREALADAALLLLATGGPGADAVMAYLSKIYHDQVGAPLTIRSWAKSGKLRPKLLHIARKSS